MFAFLNACFWTLQYNIWDLCSPHRKRVGRKEGIHGSWASGTSIYSRGDRHSRAIHSHSPFLSGKCKLSPYGTSVNRLLTGDMDGRLCAFRKPGQSGREEGCLFPLTVITSNYNLGGLTNNHTQIYSLLDLKTRCLKSRFWRGHSLQSARKKRISSAPGGWWHSLAYSHFTPTSLFISLDLLLCVCVKSSLCLSLKRTLTIGFRAHLNNPGWSHPEILNFICQDPLFWIRLHSQVPGGLILGMEGVCQSTHYKWLNR